MITITIIIDMGSSSSSSSICNDNRGVGPSLA